MHFHALTDIDCVRWAFHFFIIWVCALDCVQMFSNVFTALVDYVSNWLIDFSRMPQAEETEVFNCSVLHIVSVRSSCSRRTLTHQHWDAHVDSICRYLWMLFQRTDSVMMLPFKIFGFEPNTKTTSAYENNPRMCYASQHSVCVWNAVLVTYCYK